MTNTKIGRFSAIGDNVRTGLGRHPTSDFTSIHPCFYSPQKQAGFSFVQNQLYEEHVYVDISNKYFVEIGSDVWIGNNVLIMDGINIADGAIIAAGSVVVKNVNPYTIVGGVPAKVIKRRFDKDQIEQLLNIKWWNWSFQKIQKKHHLFYNIIKFLQDHNRTNMV
jgi:acetyltransferase-like isoleucine patch superfamily enzyme